MKNIKQIAKAAGKKPQQIAGLSGRSHRVKGTSRIFADLSDHFEAGESHRKKISPVYTSA